MLTLPPHWKVLVTGECVHTKYSQKANIVKQIDGVARDNFAKWYLCAVFDGCFRISCEVKSWLIVFASILMSLTLLYLVGKYQKKFYESALMCSGNDDIQELYTFVNIRVDGLNKQKFCHQAILL